MHPNIYTYTCVRVCVTRLCIHYPFICICENRSGLYMRAPVRDGDGSAVCACVGGHVLRARPETRNPKPCEPLPVGVDRVVASARRRSARRRRSTPTSARGTQPRSPRCLMYAPLPARRRALMAGRARPGFDAARPVVRGGTADARACAHTCRPSLARGRGCGYGRAEGRFGACIRIYIHIRVCVCVLQAYAYIIHLSVYVRIGRGYICVHQCGW
jgi:hypothetical protein